jgi:hypothetical protein
LLGKSFAVAMVVENKGCQLTGRCSQCSFPEFPRSEPFTQAVAYPDAAEVNRHLASARLQRACVVQLIIENRPYSTESERYPGQLQHERTPWGLSRGGLSRQYSV